MSLEKHFQLKHVVKVIHFDFCRRSRTYLMEVNGEKCTHSLTMLLHWEEIEPKKMFYLNCCTFCPKSLQMLAFLFVFKYSNSQSHLFFLCVDLWLPREIWLTTSQILSSYLSKKNEILQSRGNTHAYASTTQQKKNQVVKIFWVKIS